MSAAGATHPPAAATSLLALETDRGYGFIMMPVAIGALILVLSARIADFSIKK
jgi:CBS-domain-containing membrane protein